MHPSLAGLVNFLFTRKGLSMATENVLFTQSFVASGNNLSAAVAQFVFVGLTTNKKILPSPAGGRTLGILQAPAKIGKSGPVAMLGVSKLRLGNTVKAGIFLAGTATGTGQPARGGGPIGAMALEDGITGDVISVFLMNGSA